MLRLYHGSIVEVRQPLVGVGRRKVDFGQGFYMTRVRRQAELWAKAVADRCPGTIAVLNIYQFDGERAMLLAAERYKKFEQYDLEWLEYVIDSRKGGKRQLSYDVVEGGVANDTVIDTFEDFENGIITAEQALGQLVYKRVNHQICIHNQKIIDECVQFVGSVKL